MATSSTTLSIVLKLIDEASGALQSTSRSFEGSLKQLEPAFARVAVVSGAAFAAVGAEIYAVTDAARESIKVQNQLNAVLKSTAEVAGITAQAADTLSKSLEGVTNFDDEAVLSAENLLLTFTKIGKDIFPQATETVLDMATALGEDTKDAAIQLGKALQDPILGVTALRRVGVNFNETQIEMIKGLVETGHQLEAQQYILKELATEFGGSARATADPVIQLKNAFGDLQEEIGKALVPVLTQIITAIRPVIDHVTAWIAAHPKLTAAILGGTAAMLGLITALATLGIVLSSLVTVAAAFGIGLAALFGWMLLIPLAIAAIIAGGYLLIKHWDAVQQKVGEFVEQHRLLMDLLALLYPAGAVVAGVVKGIEWMVQHWDLIKQKIDEVIGVFHTLIDVYNQVKEMALKPIKFSINAVGSAVSSFTSAVGSLIPHFASGGIVTGPTVALVGEAGPEAIVPLSGGRGAGLGGINVYIQGGYYLDQQASRGFADMIAKTLNQQLRLRSI